MDSKGRIDIPIFDARVRAVKADPRFHSAKARFCHDVPERWLNSPINRALIADTGAYALTIAIIGMNRIYRVDGASMQTVIKALEAGGMASATRIRSLIDILVHRGAIKIVAHEHDRRRRRLEPTDALIEAQRAWFESVLLSVSEVFDLPLPAHELAHVPDLVERYLTGVMLRHLMDRFTILDGFPEVEAFMNRRHGYLLMLQLAGSDGLVTMVSRNRFAHRLGVSPAHIATMLADAEERGWLWRVQPSSQIVLSPEFADILDTWVARELVIVGLWIEARFGQKR
jgi:DNA-binding MarR family transcriptional regulator